MRLLRTISVVGLLLIPLRSAGQAPPPGEDVRRIDERIQSLQKEAEGLAGTARTLVGELRALEVERDLRAAEAAKAEAAARDAQRLLAGIDTRLVDLEHERIAQLPGLQAQLVNLYKRGSLGYSHLLFAASDVRELGRASRTMAALVARDQRRLEQHRQTLASLQQERSAKAATAGELDVQRTAAIQARTLAERAVSARAARIAQIDSRRDLAAQYVGELQIARDSLLRTLPDVQPSSASASLLPFRGALDWPADGRLSGLFGQASNRLGGSVVRNGIEITAPDGAVVRAVHRGTVAHAAPYSGFGNLVIVDHGNDHYSLYGYLGAMSVTVGQAVEAGAEVGAVGPSPAGPSALYFELRVDGRSVDPVQWLKPR